MNDKYLKESIDILNRKFGDPLPTLEDTMKWHKEQKLKELKFGSKAQYDKYKKDHNIKPGTEIEIDGKKSVEKGEAKPNKKVDKQMSKAADDANAKMDAAEKAEKKKKLNYDSVDDFEDSLDDNPDFEKDLSDDEKDKLGDLLDLWQNAQSDREQDPDGGDHDGDIEDAKKEINKLLKLENKANRAIFLENPIVAATVMQMTKMKMKNPKTGKTIKAVIPLKDKSHPLHKKSKGIFAKIKDALKKKKKPEPKKQSKSDADFYKRQFTGVDTEKDSDKGKQGGEASASDKAMAMKGLSNMSWAARSDFEDEYEIDTKNEKEMQNFIGGLQKDELEALKKTYMKKKHGKAESVNEGPDDVRFARRALSKIAKHEASLRKAMFELEQAFLRDPRPENQKLAKEIKKNYKTNVTGFMKDSVQMIKRMK